MTYILIKASLSLNDMLFTVIISFEMGCAPCHQCTHECKKCMKPPRPRKTTHNIRKSQNTTRYVVGLKGKVKEEVEDNDDFLTHHLQNQACLTQFASTHKIRARQIIEHYLFSDLNHAKDLGSVSTSKLTQFALKSWFQRTFIQVLDRGEKGFLQENKKYNDIRQQVAEEYIFQIYQMGEFINAGFGRFSTSSRHIQVPLSLVMLNSDSALFALLGKLQQNYPLVSDVPNISFPNVANESSNINVLKLINSKAYSDPDNLNRQSLMDDLKTIINEANDLFPDFKDDMKEMLGNQTETDCKVKRKVQSNGIVYSAEAVRRCFVKWSQKMIDLIPEVYTVKQFLEFVRSKKKMANEFIFKGTVSPTTHQQVIDSLSELLQSLKYKTGTNIPRQEFGLFIYDFLRCKTTRHTGEEVVDLLNKMKSTKVTKSGKMFEVVRVKNRFKWATRDILINFRYGEHLVGEAQLCVDVSHDSPELGKQIKFRHYLYELERGLFGPTFQMIMQYQDFTRKDIVVTLETQGLVKRRQSKDQNSLNVKNAKRKCPQNHDMIELKGDLYAEDKITGLIDKDSSSYVCDFCFTMFPLSKEYHYCYYCSIFYCTSCIEMYNKTNKNHIELSCRDYSIFKPIQTMQQFKRLCVTQKAVLIIFYRHSGTPSKIFLDSIAYLYSAFKTINRKLPQIYTVNVGKPQFQKVMKQYSIQRTPTTVIANSKQECQVTLVGATFHDIESLFKVRERIAKHLPKGLSLKCAICHQPMMNQAGKDKSSAQCQICMDTNKIDDLRDVIRMLWVQTHDFVCKNNHVRCAYCSYLSSDGFSFYRDFTGRTYLSNKFNNKPSECSKGHQMKIVPQPKQFTCSSCGREYQGNNEETINICIECQEFICVECQQTDMETLKEKYYRSIIKQIQVVTHFVEDRLEESYPCGCGKYFLKVYQSRRIDDKIRVGAAIKQLVNEGVVNWKCYVCQKSQTKLRVHLACFYCTYAQEINKRPSHIEICINCAVNSGLIGRQPVKKIYEMPTDYTCRKGHNIIKTALRTKDELLYSCIYCDKNYYPYTQHYECRLCKQKICESCGQKRLTDNRSFITEKKCDLNHQLLVVKKSPKLQFCRRCKIYLRDIHFKCPSEGCRYSLCLSCSDSQTKRIQEGSNKVSNMDLVASMVEFKLK